MDITADRAEVVIHIFFLFKGGQGFLIKLGMNLFGLVGEMEDALGLVVAFRFRFFNKLGIHLGKLIRFPVNGSL